MYGISSEDVELFAAMLLQKSNIRNAFEEIIREKYADRFQNVEVALEKRNDKYIDGEVSKWFEFFEAGYLIASGRPCAK